MTLEQWELNKDQLKRWCSPEELEFETTEQIEPIENIIGQERAVSSMKFGLKVKKKGYNIYVTGNTGTGRTTYAQSIVQEQARQEKTPDDWCYVYNFDKPDQPIALSFPSGMGREFQKDMKKMIEVLKIDIPNTFEGEGYEKEKTEIMQEYQKKTGKLMDELNDKAKEQGFILKRSGGGFVTTPIIDGEQMSQKEYEQLDEQTKKEIEEKSNQLQVLIMEYIKKIKNVEKKIRSKIEILDKKVGLSAAEIHFDELKSKYKDCCRDDEKSQKVIQYLESVQEDILENIDKFLSDETDQDSNPLLVISKMDKESYMYKYDVNLLVDSSSLEGAPVVCECNPTFPNLVGKFEYQNQFGTLRTDFTKIKPGLLHQANGGYLILDVNDIFNNPYSWHALKQALKSNKLTIETLGEIYGGLSASGLKPEPIPLQIKIILIGNSYSYYILYNYEEDFKKLFKIKADFDITMERNVNNYKNVLGFISYHCNKENLKHVDASGVARIIEYSSRLAEHQDKLSTQFNDLVEILYEADVWASIEGDDIISEKHIKKAIQQKRYRSAMYRDKINEMLEEETILLDIEGEKIGQVNGLSVINMGDSSFGRPSRITATVFSGQDGIINIERETKMSGSIHDKGVLILSGFLGERFARKNPLSITANICFEQLYGGVDGDSASSAELYAILSSLAEIPIKQCIAVTGSVNQKGEIQPIGGVNQKIEGFFEVCRRKGLNGKQGVIIPHQNIKNLMLADQVIEAVQNKMFHIYTIKDVDQGIEILTGIPAGQRDEKGEYPEGTVNYMVEQKLKYFAELQKKDGEE
ncbi:MAG: ATP-binding protein [Clostridia bacterium]|nr:ATP-binding protein [Clostridia bacterium]